MSMQEPFRVGEVITYYEKKIPGVVTAVEWREAARDFYYKVQSLGHPEVREFGWMSVKDDDLRKAGKDITFELARIERDKFSRASVNQDTVGIGKAEYIAKKVSKKIENFSLRVPHAGGDIFEIGGRIIEAYDKTGRGPASIYARVFAATAPAQKAWLKKASESVGDWTYAVHYFGEATDRLVDEIRIKTVLSAIDNALESFNYTRLFDFVAQIGWVAGEEERYEAHDLRHYWESLSPEQKERAIADNGRARRLDRTLYPLQTTESLIARLERGEKASEALNTPTSKQTSPKQAER